MSQKHLVKNLFKDSKITLEQCSLNFVPRNVFLMFFQTLIDLATSSPGLILSGCFKSERKGLLILKIFVFNLSLLKCKPSEMKSPGGTEIQKWNLNMNLFEIQK